MDLNIMIPDAHVRDAFLRWLGQPKPPLEPLGSTGAGRTELLHGAPDVAQDGA